MPQPSMLARSPVADRHVQVNGLRLHYRDSGDPAAPPALVLHGIMGHSREWDTLTGALAEHFRVLAIDQRGHGESDWASGYTAPALAADLLALIGRLELPRVHLIGHSLGALASTLAAAERPDLVDRLVLIDIGPDSLDTEWGRNELPGMLAAFAEVSYPDSRTAVAEWLAGNPLAREPLLRHYVEHCLVRRDDGRLHWRFDATGLARSATRIATAQELWAAIDRIEAPTLLVRGAHSPLLSRSTAEHVAGRLAHGRLVEIPGGGHDLGVEQPEAVTAATIEFLRA